MESALSPAFDLAVPSFETAVAPRRTLRLTTSADPVTVSLQMVNWLVLMVLMSGFMLAATMSDRAEPAGSSSQIGTAATH